jgi:penicillin-binding protein 2
LIKGIGDKDIIKPEYTLKNYAGISPNNFEPLIDGMQAVVDHGTAAASKIPGIVMCGKTGTAQVHGLDNSVFVAFAPRDNPKIAIAVIVENAGQGAHWAAPIASYMVEKYLTDTISRPMDEFNRIKDANLMPDPATYYSASKHQAVRDSLRRMRDDSLKKLKEDSLRKKAPVKSVSSKKSASSKIAFLASPMKRREHGN